jgi:hypothetical protein
MAWFQNKSELTIDVIRTMILDSTIFRQSETPGIPVIEEVISNLPKSQMQFYNCLLTPVEPRSLVEQVATSGVP